MKTLKSFLSESAQLDEAYSLDIINHKEGDIIHPIRYTSHDAHYGEPHIITKNLATKTKIKNIRSGEEYEVSHATGKVKNSTGEEERWNFQGFGTPAEKEEHDAYKQKRHEKNAAHSAIQKHLEGMKNRSGEVVGKLSPEVHAEILTHLEKLKK